MATTRSDGHERNVMSVLDEFHTTFKKFKGLLANGGLAKKSELNALQAVIRRLSDELSSLVKAHVNTMVTRTTSAATTATFTPNVR